MSPEEALLDAAARLDLEAFDVAAGELGGGRAVLGVLLATEEDRAEVLSARLPVRSPGHWTPQLDVASLVREGPVGLWVATDWALRVLPRHERRAPSPAHEQWDALLGIHASRPESVWLAIELVAALDPQQRSLGRRAALGLERRFGDRARRVARARLAMGDVALMDLLAEVAGSAG